MPLEASTPPRPPHFPHLALAPAALKNADSLRRAAQARTLQDTRRRSQLPRLNPEPRAVGKMSLWDALTDIQKKVSEGVEQFQEVFDPNSMAPPPPRSRPVSSAAFSVDNEDAASKKPGEEAPSRAPDASQLPRHGAPAASRQQHNSGTPSRTLASASRDELVALVQRQAAKIQQLQGRFEESHQENLVLRQERDTLKNMLRSSDAELTEMKKSITSSAISSGPSHTVSGDAVMIDSLRSQILHLESLLTAKSNSNPPAQASDSRGDPESGANSTVLLENDALKSDCSQLQIKIESMNLENQLMQRDHASSLQTLQQRISMLESENAALLRDTEAYRILASKCDAQTAEANNSLQSLKAQLAASLANSASSDLTISELRSTIQALEMSLASYASFAQSKFDAEGGCKASSDSSSSTASATKMCTESHVPSNTVIADTHPDQPKEVSVADREDSYQIALSKARALAESASAEAVASREQLALAESRIMDLTTRLNDLESQLGQVAQGSDSSIETSHQSDIIQNNSLETTVADAESVRSEMQDLITAIDQLSAAVASVNFPNQPALPTHSLPCHLSKVAFMSFKQLADAVDALVSQLADVDFNSRQAFKALKLSSDSECDKLKSLLSSCRSQLDQMGPELDSSRSRIKKLEQQLSSTEGLYKTLQSELTSSEQVRQALNIELKRLEQALSISSSSVPTSSSDSSLFINALQWNQVGEPAGWSIRRRVHVDACVWALVCSGNYRFWMIETDLMRHLGEKGVSVGTMFDGLPPPIVLDTRDHAAANILKEKQIEIVSLEKKVHELTNELQKLQIKSWVQPQHEPSDFLNQDVAPSVIETSTPTLSEVESDFHHESDRLVLLVGDLERKLAFAHASHAQTVANLRSEIESAQAKVVEAEAAARELLHNTQEQLEQQCKARIEEIKRKSRVIADEQALVIINLRKKARVLLTRDSDSHQVTKFPVPLSVLRSVNRMQNGAAQSLGSVSSVVTDSDYLSDDNGNSGDTGAMSTIERCSSVMESAWSQDAHTHEASFSQSMTAESLSMMGHMQAEILRLTHANEELRTSLEHCRACEQAMEQHNSSLQAEIQQLKAIDRKSPLNMEYIRNVVVKYIETLDHHGLVPVIATVLQLEDPIRSRIVALAMKRPASNTSFVSSIGGGAMSALSSLLPLPKNGTPSKN